jgi:hypothetical protein
MQKSPAEKWGFLFRQMTVLPGGIEPTFEVPETPVLSIELWEL